MKIDDELHKQLTDLYWDVLNANEYVERFKDEFYDAALNDGFELDDIDEYWGM